MINYQNAIKIINKVFLNLPNEKISISDSVNRVCAQNILSPSTNPLANNTSFDGFAVLAKETKGLSKKKLKNLRF
jgi:molybdopterin biosynthesis enzyme